MDTNFKIIIIVYCVKENGMCIDIHIASGTWIGSFSALISDSYVLIVQVK